MLIMRDNIHMKVEKLSEKANLTEWCAGRMVSLNSCKKPLCVERERESGVRL